MQSYMGVFSGRILPEKALQLGLVKVEGEPDALTRFLSLCGVKGKSGGE